MKPTIFFQRDGEQWILLEEHEKIVEYIRQEERSRSDLYMQGYADGREDQAIEMRDAAHVVEQLLDEYPYGSEGYQAITTAGNRLRILAGKSE